MEVLPSAQAKDPKCWGRLCGCVVQQMHPFQRALCSDRCHAMRLAFTISKASPSSEPFSQILKANSRNWCVSEMFVCKISYVCLSCRGGEDFSSE